MNFHLKRVSIFFFFPSSIFFSLQVLYRYHGNTLPMSYQIITLSSRRFLAAPLPTSFLDLLLNNILNIYLYIFSCYKFVHVTPFLSIYITLYHCTFSCVSFCDPSTPREKRVVYIYEKKKKPYKAKAMVTWSSANNLWDTGTETRRG